MKARMVETRSGRLTWLGMLVAAVAMASLGLGRWSPTARAADEEESPLAKQMEKINEEYKNLRRAARGGAYDDECLAGIVKMQQAVMVAKTLEPPMAKKVPADKKKAFLRGYQKTLAKLMMQLAEIEIALIEERSEDATKGIENLALIKKEGHDAYIEE